MKLTSMDRMDRMDRIGRNMAGEIHDGDIR